MIFLYNNFSSCNEVLSLLNQKELVELRKYLFPDIYVYRTPPNWKGLNDPRFRTQFKQINKLKTKPKIEIIEDICRFGFTISQVKFLVLIYKLLQLIGNPTIKLKKIIKKLRIPYRKLRYADYVRYYYIGNLYQKPSKIIETLYKLSKNKEVFLKFLTIKNSQSKILFDDILRQIKIEDTIDSLPSNCLNYKRYFHMNELFKDKEFNILVAGIEAYPKGKKHEKSEQLVFHTNIALTDLIDKLDEKRINEYRDYLCKKYGMNNENLNIDVSKFKERLKMKMEERNEDRKEDLYANSDFWGKKLLADDGDLCDSSWEVEIDNFLYENNIMHEKPCSAMKGQYYLNTAMYPDWIAKNVMIELFGAEYIEGYIEKMEYKQKNNVLPLISITVDDYNLHRWEKKILKELNQY